MMWQFSQGLKWDSGKGKGFKAEGKGVGEYWPDLEEKHFRRVEGWNVDKLKFKGDAIRRDGGDRNG